MKRIITVFFLIIISFMSFTIAEDKSYESLMYTVLKDGTVRIDNIIGTQKTLNIPSSIDGRAVSQIGREAIGGSAVEQIVFPDTITDIDGNPFIVERSKKGFNNSLLSSLTSFRISPSHQYLATIDGSLYSKPDKRLIYYIPNYIGNGWNFSYAIPDGIEIIGEYAFYCRTPGYTLKTLRLRLPSTIKAIEQYAILDSGLLLVVLENIPPYLERIEDCGLFGKVKFDNHKWIMPDTLKYVNTPLGLSPREYNSGDNLTIVIDKNFSAEIDDYLGKTNVIVDKSNLKYGVLDDFLIEKSTMTVIQPINMDMYDRTTITIPSGVRAIEGIWLSDSSWTKELILPETLKKNRHICGIRRNIRKKFCS